MAQRVARRGFLFVKMFHVEHLFPYAEAREDPIQHGFRVAASGHAFQGPHCEPYTFSREFWPKPEIADPAIQARQSFLQKLPVTGAGDGRKLPAITLSLGPST